MIQSRNSTISQLHNVVVGKENAEERGGGCRGGDASRSATGASSAFHFRDFGARIELPGSVKRVLHGILLLEPPRLNPSTRGASETEYEWNVADRCKFSECFL